MLSISSSENLWYCSIICSSHVYFFIGQGESSRAATSEEALLCWKSLLLSSVASHSSLLVCSCTTCLGLKQASLRRQKEKAGAPPKRLQSTNTALKRQQMATLLTAEDFQSLMYLLFFIDTQTSWVAINASIGHHGHTLFETYSKFPMTHISSSGNFHQLASYGTILSKE